MRRKIIITIFIVHLAILVLLIVALGNLYFSTGETMFAGIVSIGLILLSIYYFILTSWIYYVLKKQDASNLEVYIMLFMGSLPFTMWSYIFY